MARTPSPSRVNLLKNTAGIVENWLHAVVKDAVEEAMRETERGSRPTGSSGRRLPTIALVVLGVVIGGYLVRRRLRRDTRPEREIQTAGEAGGTADDSSAAEDESATADPSG